MQVEKTKENLKKCLCMKCPSYTTSCKLKAMPETIVKLFEDLDKVEHFEGMFCAFEKSNCIHENKGCKCVDCPIYTQYDLVREDYCLKTGGCTPYRCPNDFYGSHQKK